MMTALALLALLGQGIPTEAEAKKAEAKLADEEAARFYVRVVCDSKKGHLWVDGVSIRDESGKELLPNGSFDQR